jgi:hypothetical protein
MSLENVMKQLIHEMMTEEKPSAAFQGIIDAYRAARKAWGHPEDGYLPGDVFRNRNSGDVYIWIPLEPPNVATQQPKRATLVKIVAQPGEKGIFSQWHGDCAFDGDEADFEFIGRRDIVKSVVVEIPTKPSTN